MRVSKSLAARAWGTVRSRRPGSAEKEGDTDMATALLDGIRVVDLSGEPAALTGRILADLGAAVVLVEPPGVDVSMQEVVFVANMGTPARYPSSHFRGVRRGANIGRTREIWPTKDGFVSFGLRGGKARAV